MKRFAARLACLALFPALLCSLSGCSGSGSSTGSGGSGTPAAPTITSFTAYPTTITAGASTNLTAVFANGTGVITPGNLAVASGVAINVTPTANTTYTLTVTGTAGSPVTATTAVTVNPAVSLAAKIGVNIGWVTDWDPTQMFADAMKEARRFGSVSKPYDETATVDTNGWPTQDAGVLIDTVGGQSWMAGSYALRFTGQATVQAWGDANVSVGTVNYDSASNTSTATVTVNPAFKQMGLIFTNTKRTPASATGSGITNVQLMRPTINGTPHPFDALFTDRFLARLKYFSALRMMDYLQTNSSTEQVWSDRSIPSNASQQQTPPNMSHNLSSALTGGSYEYAIQLANETGKDLWLTIPHLAFGGTYAFSSTTWASNLALLLKYGSDASGNPYTGPNGSTGTNPQPTTGPVNPPLNPGLHVYVEWSNEFWSGVGNQTTWIQQQAQAAIDASDPDLDWDHDSNLSDIEHRINAKGVMLIANAFANVYGSANFGTVFRPILAGQIAYDATYSAGLDYLTQRHGGAGQYVWAVGGAPYVDYNGDTQGNTMTAAQIISGMQSYQTANVAPWIANLESLAKSYNLAGGMLAYEGGEGAIYQTKAAANAQIQPAMRGITTTVLDSWFSQGGGMFFYYKLCSADTWGLAEDISYDIDADSGYTPDPATSTEAQPKWGAIKQVATLGQ